MIRTMATSSPLRTGISASLERTMAPLTETIRELSSSFRAAFEALKIRYYDLLGLNGAGVPALEWHRRLAEAITGFAVQVALPEGIPGAPEGAVIVDQPVSDVAGLRDALKVRLPDAARKLDDSSLIVSVNGAMVLSNEDTAPVRSGDEVAIVRIMAGG